jgi:DNA repair ATPase RecN
MSDNLPILNRKIKSVRLFNFQNHRDNIFYLADGLNILTGSNDNGKSAIARGLDFALNNNKSGDIVRYNQKECFVEIQFLDGSTLKRYAAPDNRVEFKYKDDIKATVYKSFGNKLPDEVKKFLGYPPISNELGPLNYSNQNNKNFLIDQSPAHLPYIISDLVGVADLETASKNLFSEVDRYSKDISKIEKEIDTLELELEEYQSLDDDIDKHDKLTTILEEIESEQNQIHDLEKAVNDVNNLVSRIRKAKKELKINSNIVETLSESVTNIEKEHSGLSQILNEYNSLKSIISKIKKYQKEIEIYQKLSEDDFLTLISDAEKNIKLINDITSSYDKLDSINNSIDKKKDEISEIDLLIKDENDELNLLYAEIKDLGLLCPECNKFGGAEL